MNIHDIAHDDTLTDAEKLARIREMHPPRIIHSDQAARGTVYVVRIHGLDCPDEFTGWRAAGSPAQWAICHDGDIRFANDDDVVVVGVLDDTQPAKPFPNGAPGSLTALMDALANKVIDTDDDA